MLFRSTAFLPDYSFKTNEGQNIEDSATQVEEAWPSVNVGTSLSGIVGGTMTLVLAACTGLVIGFLKRRKRKIIPKM